MNPRGLSDQAQDPHESPRDPLLLTYKQAGKLLQVTDRTVFALVKSGQLIAVRFRQTVRIDRRDLETFIQQAKEGQAGARAD